MLIKKISHASIVTVTFTVISLVLVLCIQSLIGKIYGAVGLGLYAAFTMFINVYSLISIFGLPIAISKYVAEYEERGEIEKIAIGFKSVVIFSIVSSIFVGMLAYYFTPLIAKKLHIEVSSDFLWLISATLLFLNMSRLAQSFNQGLLRALRSSLIQSSAFVIMLLVVLYAYFIKRIPVYYPIGIGYLFSGILGMFLCISRKKETSVFSKELLFEIIKFSIPITITSQLFFISQWIDRFALGLYIGVAEIGIFTVGITIIQGVLQIPVSLNAVLLPSFSKINIYGQEKLGKGFNLNLKIASIFLFLGGALVFLFAKEIIYVLFRSRFEEFKQSVIILQILSASIFLSAIAIPASNLITGGGKPKFTAMISMIGVIFQIFFVISLTKNFGIIGTAIAGNIALLIITGLDIYVVTRIFNIEIRWKGIFYPLIACLTSVLIFVACKIILKNIIVSGFLLCLIYLLLTWFYVLNSEEKKILSNAIQH